MRFTALRTPSLRGQNTSFATWPAVGDNGCRGRQAMCRWWRKCLFRDRCGLFPISCWVGATRRTVRRAGLTRWWLDCRPCLIRAVRERCATSARTMPVRRRSPSRPEAARQRLAADGLAERKRSRPRPGGAGPAPDRRCGWAPGRVRARRAGRVARERAQRRLLAGPRRRSPSGHARRRSGAVDRRPGGRAGLGGGWLTGDGRPEPPTVPGTPA